MLKSKLGSFKKAWVVNSVKYYRQVHQNEDKKVSTKFYHKCCDLS